MFKTVFADIEEEIAYFQQQYKQQFLHENQQINDFLSFLSSCSGKQIRPAVVLLCAGANGNLSPQAYRFALAVELLHSSSIVHDDVVDEGLIRRNKPTFNAVFGSKAAVLIGDYLLSKSLKILAQENNQALTTIISEIGQAMATGELLQLKAKEAQSLTFEHYLEIVYNKTAFLFASCFYLGALAATQNQENAKKWFAIGSEFGYLFQFRDDLADYISLPEHDKDQHKDILEKKITLPLILALEQEKDSKDFLTYYFNNQGSQQEIETIIATVVSLKAVEKAKRLLDEKKAKIEVFLSSLPASKYQKVLYKLLCYYSQIEK